MDKERSNYRHPKHEEMAAMLLAGAKNTEVVRDLKVDRRAVSRAREILGLGRSHGNGTSREDKVKRFSIPYANGHTGWSGRTATSGAPVIRQNGVEIPAAHVAFEQFYKRPPVGIVKAVCPFPDCLTPGHADDELGRRKLRMQERVLHGLNPVPWDFCPKNLHPWDRDGRLEPDLTPYCKGCNTQRARRVRDAKKEEASS
jgi:hypothetical protein